MLNSLILSLSLIVSAPSVAPLQPVDCKQIVAVITPELSRPKQKTFMGIVGKTDVPRYDVNREEFLVLKDIRDFILSDKFNITPFLKDPATAVASEIQEARIQLADLLVAKLNIPFSAYRKAERAWLIDEQDLQRNRKRDFIAFISAMSSLDQTRQSLISQFRAQTSSDAKNLSISNEGREALFVLYRRSSVSRTPESVENFVRFLLQDKEIARNELTFQEADTLKFLKNSIENYPIEKAIQRHLMSGQSVQEFSRTLAARLEGKDGWRTAKKDRKVFARISREMKVFGGSHYDRMLRFVYFIFEKPFDPSQVDAKTRKKYRKIATILEDQIPRGFFAWGHPIRRSANLIKGSVEVGAILGVVGAIGIGGSHLANWVGTHYPQKLPESLVAPLQAAPRAQQIYNYRLDALEKMDPVIDFSQKKLEPWMEKEFWPVLNEGYGIVKKNVEEGLVNINESFTPARQTHTTNPR